MMIPNVLRGLSDRRAKRPLVTVLALLILLYIACAPASPTTALAKDTTTTSTLPPNYATMIATSYHTVLVDSVHIFYREAGPTHAPTIVLLPGDPSTSHEFRDLISSLSDRYHVIAPDYPGFGYSDAPSPDTFAYTYDHLARVTDDLLSSLRMTRYSLYMQDIGGPIGLRIATMHPERVQSLIIQNANAYQEGLSAAWAPIEAYWANRNPTTESEIASFFTPQGVQMMYTQGAHNPSLISPDAWTSDEDFLAQPGHIRIQLDLTYDYSTNPKLYPTWQAYFRAHQPPTLIVWGENDPFFTLAGAEAYKRDLPHAELHLLNAGHFALEEDHNTIATLMRQFLLSHRLPGQL